MPAIRANCRSPPPPPLLVEYHRSPSFALLSPLLLLLLTAVRVGRCFTFTAITATTMTPGGRSDAASPQSPVATATATTLHAIVPKEETNALRFVRENPTYDGRGVTIGVLDTGVDPGAIGMQDLPSGADAGGGGGPKLVNIVDCTGSGDVDVTTEVDATFVAGSKGEGGNDVGYWEVKGLTGRTLRLNPNWNIGPFPVALPVATGNETTTNDEPKSNSTDKGEEKTADDVPSTGEEKDGDEKKSKEDEGKDSAKEGDVRKVRVRLGIKRAYELFPRTLVNRVKEHRKKAFDEEQRRHAAVVRKELERWREENPNPKNVTHEHVRVREDLEARLEFLEPSSNGGNGEGKVKWEDPGPVYDCIVYHDGTDYRAAIDVNEDGDLTEAEAFTDFDKEPTRYGTFGNVDLFNYGVHVYDDGRTLSIVCDAGAHGSHVAGIAAAFHHPTEGGVEGGGDGDEGDVESGNINGVAPGARVISLKVGDTRLGSMETGTALTRALIEAVRLKCDVINLSYGEASALPDSGRFVRLAEDVVQRHGVFFVSSAGNNGPAISTVGSPGGTSSSVLSVAAYVSPAMMEVGYSLITNPRWANADDQSGKDADAVEVDGSTKGATPVNVETTGSGSEVDVGSSSVLRDALTGSTYTWSSVGPSVDGDQGVHVCAPGGAITCVPNWTLQRKRLMNGTSMSSPHVAGCIALLLSAAKAAGIAINPNRVRRAIQNTAKVMDGLSNLEQGFGMIQVDRAWEYLVAHRDDPNEDVCFKVCIDNRAGRPRGVYLRQPDEVSARQTLSVNVDPQFRKDDVDPETQRLRVEFEMHVKLVSTAPSWVRTPDHLVLVHNGRSFKIEVDPTALPHGIHTAHVHGYDADKPDGGPMFSVPITAVKSLEKAINIPLGKLRFKPSEVKRHFLDVPHGATWMDVSVKDCRGGVGTSSSVDKDASPRLVVLHTLQLLPHQPYSRAEKERYLNLLPGQMTVTSIPVHAGVVCELALARYWSAIGETAVEVEVNFRGIRPIPETIHMASGGRGAQIRLVCDLQDETIQPSAKLSKWLTPLQPKTSGSVTSLGERDVLPSENRRIYQTVLTYEFTQEDDGGAFTPRVPSLQGYLYESAYESQLLMVYDGEKKLLGVTDTYPGEVKVPKGTVTLRLQVRHDDPEMLNKLKDQTIWIERKLGKDISLSIYDSHASMVSGLETFKKRSLRKGNSLAVFVAEPASSKLPKGCKCGDLLEGSITYGSGEGNLPGQGKKPGGFTVRYTVGPTDSNKDSSKGNGVTPELPDERSETDKLEEAVAKLRVEKLEKLSSDDKADEKFQELYKQILGNSSDDNLPLCMVGLRHHDQERWREKRLSEIIEAADRVINAIDENELVLHYGVTGYFDKEDAKACKERKEMDEKKDALVEAFARKARAQADIDSKEVEVKDSNGSSFDDTLKQLRKWVDIDSNSKYAVLTLERERRAGRPGAVLKLLNKLLDSNGDETKGGICKLSKPDLLKRRAAVFDELGFKHLVEYDRMWRLISSPKDYAPF